MSARGVYHDSLVVGSLQLPGFNPIAAGVAKFGQSLTPAAVAGNSTVEQQFTVQGVLPGDAVEINPPALTPGVALANARVSAANTVQIQFVNSTAGSLTPPAGSHIFVVVR